MDLKDRGRHLIPALLLSVCALGNSAQTPAEDAQSQFAATILVRMQALAAYIPSHQSCYGHEVNMALELYLKAHFPQAVHLARADHAAFGVTLAEIEETYRNRDCQDLIDRENQAVSAEFDLPIVIEELEQ